MPFDSGAGGASIARKKIIKAMIKPQGGTVGQSQPRYPSQGATKARYSMAPQSNLPPGKQALVNALMILPRAATAAEQLLGIGGMKAKALVQNARPAFDVTRGILRNPIPTPSGVPSSVGNLIGTFNKVGMNIPYNLATSPALRSGWSRLNAPPYAR